MKSIAFVFPGQGSQHIGMGRDLVHLNSAASETFATADRAVGFSLSSLCIEGPAETLTDTVNAQPALLAASIAAFRTWQVEASPPLPAFVAGHSMGEFSALVAADVLTFEDGVRLVRERGRLMKRAGEEEQGGMAAILGLDRANLEDACRQARQETGLAVQVANDNAPGQIVISGHRPALARAGELARAAGARRVVPLAVSIAAHSNLMLSIVEDFRRAIEATAMIPPRIPIVGNMSARPLDSEEAIREELVGQLTAPVRWVESVDWMVRKGVDTFVEVGPGTVLSSLIRRIAPDAKTLNVGDATSLKATMQAVQAVGESGP